MAKCPDLAINIASMMDELFDRWTLSRSNISVFTSDSAANMVTTATVMDLPRLPCYGHVLHNAVSKGIDSEEIKSTTAKLKRIVAYFHQSHSQAKRLEKEQKNLGKVCSPFMAPVPHAWGAHTR